MVQTEILVGAGFIPPLPPLLLQMVLGVVPDPESIWMAARTHQHIRS